MDMEREPEMTPTPPWWRVALIGRRPKRTLARLSALVVITLLVFRFVLVLVRIDGISMSPTYLNNHTGVVFRLAYLFRDPQRGDVVAMVANNRVEWAVAEYACFGLGAAFGVAPAATRMGGLRDPFDRGAPAARIGPVDL